MVLASGFPSRRLVSPTVERATNLIGPPRQPVCGAWAQTRINFSLVSTFAFVTRAYRRAVFSVVRCFATWYITALTKLSSSACAIMSVISAWSRCGCTLVPSGGRSCPCYGYKVCKGETDRHSPGMTLQDLHLTGKLLASDGPLLSSGCRRQG